MTPCGLCGGSPTPIAERDRDGAPLRTVLCDGCGLVRHAELPSAEALAAFYREAYRREYHGEEAPSQRRVVRAWRRGQALFRRLKPFVPAGGSVFEVGAGLGLNLIPFAEAGRRTRGLEPNLGFGAFAREALRAPVEAGALEEAPEDPSDLVLLTHVLEHLRDPRGGLETIAARLLAPGGAVYVECPNVAAPHARPDKLFHTAHLFNFCPETLDLVAAQAGFVVAERFAGPRDPTLAVLLRRGEARVAPDPTAAARVRRALRTGWLGYHLRPSYLRLRALKLGERLREALDTAAAYEALLRARGRVGPVHRR